MALKGYAPEVMVYFDRHCTAVQALCSEANKKDDGAHERLKVGRSRGEWRARVAVRPEIVP
jgi:hypothetical protein